MLMRFVYLSGLIFTVAGCTVLTSETPEQIIKAGERPEGIHYALPRGVVEASLMVAPDTGAFRIDVSEPKFVPDPSHEYYLRYQPLPNYNDIAKVTVSDRGFVKQIDVDTTDKTGDIIVSLAKALSAGGAFEAGEAAATPEETLLTLTFDPVGPEASQVQDLFNTEIKAYVSRRRDICNKLGSLDGKAVSYKEKSIDAAEAIAKQKISLNSIATIIGRLTAAKDRFLRGPTSGERLDDVDAIPHPYKKLKDVCANGPDPKLNTLFTCYCQALAIDQQARPLDPQGNPKARTYTCTPPPAARVSRAPNAPRAGPRTVTEFLQSPVEVPSPEETQLVEKRLEFLNLLLLEWQDKEADEKKELDGLNAEKSAHDQQRKTCDQRYAGLGSDDKLPRVVIKVHDYSEAAHEALQSAGTYQVASTEWTPKVERTDAPGVVADCTIGVCYRPTEPYRIDYYVEVDGAQEGAGTRIMELPNRAPLVAIDIRRAFLVQKLTTIDFNDDGFLNKVRVKKPSELLALSELPLAVMDGILEGFRLRADILTEQKNAAAKEVELLKARQALAQTQAEARGGPPLESAVQRTIARPPGRGVSNFPQALPEESP